MKASTLLKLRNIKRSIKQELSHVTEDELAMGLGATCMLIVLAVSAAIVYSMWMGW